MFNGIIYNTEIVNHVLKGKNSIEITVKTILSFKKNEIGSSISCNGVCLTLKKIKKKNITFYLSNDFYELNRKTN